MIAIINYGVGNLFSLQSSFKAINFDVVITSNPDEILKADKIILPGVGAFGDAAEKLFSSGLAEPLIEQAHNKIPILGICVGMQLLFTKSFEFGEHKGLNLIPGYVDAIAKIIPSDLKIPQIGWNALDIKKFDGVFKNSKQGDFVYFVHSYSAFCDEKYITSTTEYGAKITASVQHENIFGVQFHPEKSGDVGLNILKAFCEV